MTLHTPTPDQTLLIQHLLSIMADLPGDLRSLIDHGDSITFTLSYEDYCRQCHMGRVQADVTVTYAELLGRTEPEYEGDTETYWDQWAVCRLIKERWNENLAANRAKGYRYE